MNYIFLLAFTSIIYIALIVFLGTSSFQQSSLVTETILVVTCLFIGKSFTYTEERKRKENNSFLEQLKILVKNQIEFTRVNDPSSLNLRIVFFILMGIVCVNIVSLYIVTNSISFDSGNLPASIKDFFVYFGSSSIVAFQLGGFILQGFLLYFLLIIINTKLPFSNYLRILGISYIGFLLGALLILVYNIAISANFNSISSFKNFYSNSYYHIIVGKISEFWTLLMLSSFIYQNEKLDFGPSVFIAFFPNIFLMFWILVF